MNQLFVSLLDRLAGQGRGHKLLQQLLQSDDVLDEVESIAKSDAFECLYKQARTCDIAPEEDAEFVGLPQRLDSLPFQERFQQHFQPRLGKRAEGFTALFDALLKPRRDLLILETGCMHIPRNWEGDG